MTRTLAPPPRPLRFEPGLELGSRLLRTAAEIGWTVRRGDEPLAIRRGARPPERLFYRAEDGWEAPIWRYPPRPGGHGDPLVLAHGLGLGSGSLDMGEERSLARRAWSLGYDVYLPEHRGDQHAIAPPQARGFDFDDIVGQDVAAVIERVRARSRRPRLLWIGHALGGQLLLGHLAAQGPDRIAAAALLATPVRFRPPTSAARALGLVTRLLPAATRIPTRNLQRMLAPTVGEDPLRALSMDSEGAALRGLLLDGSEDLAVGLVRQLRRWVNDGWMSDRGGAVDTATALRGTRLPVLLVAAEGDPISPPWAMEPLREALAVADPDWLVLGRDWGHLDLLVGRRAPGLHDRVLEWLERHRARCGFPEAQAGPREARQSR